MPYGTQKVLDDSVPKAHDEFMPKPQAPKIGRPRRIVTGTSDRQVKVRLTESEHRGWLRAAGGAPRWTGYATSATRLRAAHGVERGRIQTTRPRQPLVLRAVGVTAGWYATQSPWQGTAEHPGLEQSKPRKPTSSDSSTRRLCRRRQCPRSRSTPRRGLRNAPTRTRVTIALGWKSSRAASHRVDAAGRGEATPCPRPHP